MNGGHDPNVKIPESYYMYIRTILNFPSVSAIRGKNGIGKNVGW